MPSGFAAKSAKGWLVAALWIGCARHEVSSVDLEPVASPQAPPPQIALRHLRDADAPPDESIVAFIAGLVEPVLQLALHEPRRFAAADVTKFSIVADAVVDVHLTDGGKTFVFEGVARGATTVLFQRADGTTIWFVVYVDMAPTPP